MRWTAGAAAAAVVVVLMTGCGEDGTSAPTVVSSEPNTLHYPTGTADVLVSVTRGYGGALADLVIAGDGAVYTPMAATGGLAAPPPGQPAQSVTVRHLTPAGLALVLEQADELHLLDPPPDYPDVGVTDMGDTTLALRDNDGEYVHSAHALGFDDREDDHARRRLDEFVDALHDLEALVGEDNIDAPELYVPEQWQVAVDTSYTSEPEKWPFDVAPALGCTAIDGVTADEVAGVYATVIDGEPTEVSVVAAFSWTRC